MLWLPLKLFKTAIRVVLVVALVPLPTPAKCISLQLTLKGRIEGSAEGVKVLVEVTSSTPGDSDKEVRQESRIKESQFTVVAFFNTTSKTAAAETCDRRPYLVTVTLTKGKQVLDRQTVTIEQDFRVEKGGDYRLTKPIMLHGDSGDKQK